MSDWVLNMREELLRMADPAVRESGLRFFKEPVKLHGVKSDAVKRLAKLHFKDIRSLGKAGIFALCEELWESGFLEEAGIACEWSYALKGEYEPSDFEVFDRWVRLYVSNWAACDTLCNHTVGTFIERFPSYQDQLLLWAGGDSRWVRRASAVSLIIPARKGLFTETIFAIADLLLMDADPMVQKGYGWMLKACSEFDPERVFAYVMLHRNTMPRTALRYAMEKLTTEKRRAAMTRSK